MTVHLSTIYLPVCLSVYLSVLLSVSLHVCLSVVHPPQSVSKLLNLYVILAVCLSVCLFFIFPLVCKSLCMSISLCVSQSVCLFVCLSGNIQPWENQSVRHTYLRQTQHFLSIDSLIALAARAITAVLPQPDFPWITRGYWLGPLTYSSISWDE